MVVLAKSLVALAASLSVVSAHPGHDVKAEKAERAESLSKLQHRSLAHCAEKLKARGIEAANVARRQEAVNTLREKRSLKRRDFEQVLNTDHSSNETYTEDTPPEILFGSNNTCILTPEVTEGPYYVSGEYVRRDVREGQTGVDLTYEVQIIDTTTCDPIPNVYLEQWATNATGVYGGIAGGSGNGVADPGNINNTAIRGIQGSDANGIVTFDTIFPGHYTGRTAHIHVLAHHNATVLANNTLAGGSISHVGQLFFDQSLISLVEAAAPYNTNTQPLTTNAQDGIFAEEAANVDPVLHYTLVGNSIEEGLFGWISFGLDSTVNKTVRAAASWTENGGVPNPNAGGPGGPGGPGGSGRPPPSGGFPPPTGAPFPTSTGTPVRRF
ncbi:aromatic compound dioxygenase [Massarina eburnea CBS 473.64]|uniref:Aromatic compound dioxygenase n=1 Tax=Massarina eburnea CBS 473.64 TaxID=1395130 RepID=A0A6A6SDI6_9PLEO|nr:aromatic compound dioxygenase [Massarina eburnea CBS 473.64]